MGKTVLRVLSKVRYIVFLVFTYFGSCLAMTLTSEVKSQYLALASTLFKGRYYVPWKLKPGLIFSFCLYEGAFGPFKVEAFWCFGATKCAYPQAPRGCKRTFFGLPHRLPAETLPMID